MIKNFLNRLRSLVRKLKPKSKSTDLEHDIAIVRSVKGKRLPEWRQLKHISKILNSKEKWVFKLSLLFLIIGIVWVGFVVAGFYRIQKPAVGGRYMEAVIGSPELINPVFASLNDVDMDLSKLIYSGLLKINDKQELVPDLAVSYEVSEDKKSYIFSLRKDVLWHDGEPFTARDVVYTIESIQNQAVNSPLLVSFQNVQVDALDDHTVQFILKEPFTAFLSSLTVGILPEHLWFDISPERMRLAQLNLQPIGTGPFKFNRLLKDESGYIYRYELLRNESYYEQSAYLEEFVFGFYADYEGEGGAIGALRQQEVDGINFVPVDLKDKVERKHITLHQLQLPQYTALFFNGKSNPVLQEKEARLALALALDKERIVRETLDGNGQVIYSPILPGFPGYNPEIERTAYSTESANEYLDELKWERYDADLYRNDKREELMKIWLDENKPESATSTEDGASTNEAVVATSTIPMEVIENIEEQLDAQINEAQIFYRKNKDGKILELDLVTTDSQDYKHAAELIAGFWQEIGIKTNIEYVPVRDLSRTVLKNRNYDVLLYGVIVGSDPDLYPFWHSSQVNYPGLNLSGYVNRNADALLTEAREATEEVKTIEAYSKFQDIIIADLPAIFLFMPTYLYATTDKVKGQDLSRIFIPADRFANVTNWYIKTRGEWDFSSSN